jgi:2-phospho-L-lactate guanylyltransferase
MPTIVVPFRGPGGKQRLSPLPEDARAALATAMLADVVAACTAVGRTLVVAPGPARDAAAAALAGTGAELVEDTGSGLGAAVAAGLAHVPAGPAVVVNADLPCVTPRDVLALLGELPPGGLALVEAADGTTNALALADPLLYEPRYGPGSAARFRRLAPAGGVRTAAIPNVVDDVDTLADLRRLEPRLGPRTRRVLAELTAEAA